MILPYTQKRTSTNSQKKRKRDEEKVEKKRSEKHPIARTYADIRNFIKLSPMNLEELQFAYKERHDPLS
jgi:hypothetical protein